MSLLKPRNYVLYRNYGQELECMIVGMIIDL